MAKIYDNIESKTGKSAISSEKTSDFLLSSEENNKE